jgi:inner membrane protein
LENFTHSLAGAVIAHAALRADATRGERRVFLAAGVIASNAPDLDLLYTSITPMPIGYLLHHRGHTHTLVGAAAIFAGLLLLMRLFRSGRSPAQFVRLCVVLGASLISHLALDAANTYGVHPFFPADNRWYYGDTFFVFEPGLWTVLSATAALNATSRVGRTLLIASVVALPISTVVAGLVPWAAIAVIGATTIVLAGAARGRPPRTRSLVALTLCALYAGAMSGLSRYARAEVRAEASTPLPAQVLDIVMTPNPAFPVCWAIIMIERDDRAGMLMLRRGSFSLLPGFHPAVACPLNRFATSRDLREAGGDRYVWVDEYRLPVDDMRRLVTDCWAAAWLRFARAPVWDGRRLFDLRFESDARGNFTSMQYDANVSHIECPPRVPPWEVPRADALAR